MRPLQSLPWLCNCSAGGAAVLLWFLLGQIVPSHSWHSLPVTCLLLQGIALEIPSTPYNGEKMGNFDFYICESLCQIFWIMFYGLIVFLMTSSTTSVSSVWVHALQMGVMGTDCCSSQGHWQASASAGLGPGAVSVTGDSVVTPSYGLEPLAVPPPCLPACLLSPWA